MAPIIEVKDLHHRYPNGFHALRGVSVTIERGEFVAIVGQNGSGKTTTMRILTCFFPPTRGRALVNGYDVTKNPVEVQRHTGYFPGWCR
jgi:ABC-2 type transport system ATP-binding protein